MLVTTGMQIKTDFLKGTVKEVIRGSERGWRDTYYFTVKLKRHRDHTVRLDEIKDFWRAPQ